MRHDMVADAVTIAVLVQVLPWLLSNAKRALRLVDLEQLVKRYPLAQVNPKVTRVDTFDVQDAVLKLVSEDLVKFVGPDYRVTLTESGQQKADGTVLPAADGTLLPPVGPDDAKKP